MKTLRITLYIAGGILVFFLAMSFIQVNNSKKIKQMQQQNNKGFAVVELFTSEGCSSCPPADELVEKILEENHNKRLYVLAFHVDYWDHQGWKDRFSKPAFTERQQRYAAWLKLETIYTPQAVINGKTERVGSFKTGVVNDISDELNKEVPADFHITGEVSNGKILAGHNAVLQKNEEVIFALIQKKGDSQVKAGENRGRNLTHVQIVRELIHAKNNQQSVINLPADFNIKGWELIALIQNKDNGHIRNATSLDFDAE